MSNLIKTFSGHNKAILAGAIAVLTAIVSSYGPSSDAGKISTIIIAGLVALGGVFTVKNVGTAKVQDVVDAVKAVVPDQTAASVTKHVAEAGGLLKDAS